MHMEVILYNPLSSKGKNIVKAHKLKSKLEKKGLEVRIENLLTIHDVKGFLAPFKETDRMIIIGGDGTLHWIVNQIEGYDVIPQVYLYKAGSGNDFLRTVPIKDKMANIKPYLKVLPTLYVNDKREKVLNGAGVGLDGLVAYKVNRSKKAKNKSNYFRNSLAGFFQFKPVAAKFTVDGKVYEEKKVWFASAMYSEYFGGGMKIAPKKSRDIHEIDLIVVRRIPKIVLLLIFPTIYLGWHLMFKRWVKVYRGKEISVEFDQPAYLQRDGEDEYPVTSFRMVMEEEKNHPNEE